MLSLVLFLCRHTVFDVNGVKHMRLQFYLEGPHHKGTAQAEVQQVQIDQAHTQGCRGG